MVGVDIALNSTATHSCGSFTNFLDLQCILVNNLSGSTPVFLIVASLGLMMLGAYLRLPLASIGFAFVLMGALLLPISSVIFVVGLMIAALFLGWQIASMWQ